MRRFAFSLSCMLLVVAPLRAQPAWGVDAKPLLDVKGLNASGAVVFGAATWATRLRNGTIVVADAGGPALHFIGPDGKLIKSTGRMGQGPGDFRTVTWVGQCGEEGIFAWDFPQMRVTTYDETGNMKRSFAFGARGGAQTFTACNAKGQLFGFGAARRLPPATPPDPNAKYGFSTIVATGAIMAPSGDTIARISEVPFGEMLLGMINGRAGGLPRPLGSTTTFAMGQDRLYLGNTDSSSIAVYSLDGRRAATIPVAVPARPLSAEQYEAATDLTIAMFPAQMRDSARAFALRAPRPDKAPPFTRLFVDPGGALWVLLSSAGDKDTRFRVFAPDGRPQASVAIPLNLDVFEVGTDYILGARSDSDGEPHLMVYKLVRGGRG